MGLQNRLDHFNQTADRVARTAPDGDLAKDMVESRRDVRGVQANAAVLRATDETIGAILDILA